MILIADSGSTKTDWLFLHLNGTTESYKTAGINPFFRTTDAIVEIIQTHLPQALLPQVTQAYFYGAGCIKGQTTDIVYQALQATLPNAQAEVESDMLGAARALLHNKEGFACILGTGANSCFYNGATIADNVPTLGYILGDEGSGANLGKLFLNDYFKRAMPSDLNTLIEEELQLHWPDVLQAVYKQPQPNSYLATFARFIGKHQTHPYLLQLVKSSFHTFFEKNIERYASYRNLPVGFSGSIALHFSALLAEVAQERGLEIGKIIGQPIDGLKEYHLQGIS